jgi:hypothetical protein
MASETTKCCIIYAHYGRLYELLTILRLFSIQGVSELALLIDEALVGVQGYDDKIGSLLICECSMAA